MATVQPARPQVSLGKKIANLTNNTAGLDLTLRLIHAIAIVVAEASQDVATAQACAMASSQLALGEST